MVKVEILDAIEDSYDLAEIGLPETELIVSEKEIYISSPKGYFPITSPTSFFQSPLSIRLTNPDGDIQIFTFEQFEIISPIIKDYFSELTNK